MAKKSAKKKPAKAKKPKAPKKPVLTKKHYEEHYQQIRDKELEVRELCLRYETAKAEASSRKKAFEESDLMLRNLINRGPDLQGKLPFPTPETPADTAADAWRKVHVDALGLPPKLAGLLIDEANLINMGELEDFRAKVSAGKEKWPKGIGEAKVTLIEDAVIKWLTTNRDKMGEPAAEPTLAEANGTRQEQLAPAASNGDGQEEFKAEVGAEFDRAGILAKS